MFRRFRFFAALGLFAAAKSSACPSYNEARQLFREQQVESAKSALTCIVREFPNDRDALRLLSEIYWQEGDTEKSEALMEKVYDQSIQFPEDTELAILATKRISRAAVSAGYQSVWGSHNTHSNEFNVDGQYRYWQKQIFQMGFDRLTRSFQNADALSDSIIRVGPVIVPHRQVYIETSAAYSPSAKFSPKWKLNAEPHFVFQEGSDISFGTKISFYSEIKTVVFKPSWQRPFGNFFSVGLSSDIEVSPDVTVAGGGWVEWDSKKGLTTKLNVSGGKTDDGDGVIDAFVSYSADVGYRIFIPFSIHLNGAIYRGKNRDEERLGGGLQWLF
jgi:hypothetical protein